MATFERSSPSILGIKTDQPECFRCDNHSVEICKLLQGRVDLCDVVLIVGDSDKRISAHRLILIASSDYFSVLLREPLNESQKREITLNKVDGDSLEKLVNYCYTGDLELRGDTIAALFTTANHLHFKKVVEGCCEFVQRHLQPSNCLAICFFAEQLNLERLLHNAKKLICENFDEVSNQAEFFLLSAKQLSEIISNDDLNTPSEEFVFRVLMKWIEYEPENRRQHFTELLAQIRLPLLPPTFLAEEVEPLCNTVGSLKLILNGLKSHLPFINYQSIDKRNYQSSVANHLLAIYIRRDGGCNLTVEFAAYNLLTNVWTIRKNPIHSRRFSAVALMDDNFIVVGGLSRGSALNTVTSFNLQTMASTEMTPLQTSRWGHRVTILNGSIYAIGGFDGCDYLYSVERWNRTSRTWSFVAPIENARFHSDVAVMNNCLYISGGYCRNRRVLTSMECYDPVKNTWRSTAPMKVGRYLHCLAAHKDYLFVIGGYNDECKDEAIPIERYNPRTETWTTIPGSPAIYGATKCASHGPDLFIINEFNIYTISSEGSCDNLKLQTLPKPYPEPMQNVDLTCVELFHTNLVHRKSWIK